MSELEQQDKEALQEAIAQRREINERIFSLSSKLPADQKAVELFVLYCIEHYRDEEEQLHLPLALQHARYYKLPYLPSMLRKHLPKLPKELKLYVAHLKQSRKLSSMIVAFKMLAHAQAMYEKEQRASSLLADQEHWHTSESYFDKLVDSEHKLDVKSQWLDSFMKDFDKDWVIGCLIDNWTKMTKEEKVATVSQLVYDFGMSIRQISERSGISKSTVARYVKDKQKEENND